MRSELSCPHPAGPARSRPRERERAHPPPGAFKFLGAGNRKVWVPGVQTRPNERSILSFCRSRQVAIQDRPAGDARVATHCNPAALFLHRFLAAFWFGKRSVFGASRPKELLLARVFFFVFSFFFIVICSWFRDTSLRTKEPCTVCPSCCLWQRPFSALRFLRYEPRLRRRRCSRSLKPGSVRLPSILNLDSTTRLPLRTARYARRALSGALLVRRPACCVMRASARTVPAIARRSTSLSTVKSRSLRPVSKMRTTMK